MTKRKNKKLIVATLLAVPAAVVIADDVKVSANTNINASEPETVVVPGNYPQIQSSGARAKTLFSASPAEIITPTGTTELQAEIKRMMSQYTTKFTIEYTKSTTLTDTFNQNEVKNNIQAAVNVILEADSYTKATFNGYTFTYSYTGNKASITMDMKYLITKEHEILATTQVNSLAATLTAGLTSDFDKVKAVHDHVVLNTTYSSSTSSTVVSPYGIYAPLFEYKGVSQAYALLIYRILHKVGIPVHYVVGKVNGVEHAWNIVQVNGEWYHLDATLDDQVFATGGDIQSKYLKYENFLLLSDQIDSTRTFNPISGVQIKAEGGVDANKNYEKIHSIVNPVQIDNKFYYAETETTEKGKFKVLDLSTMSATPFITADIQFLNYLNGWFYFSNLSDKGYLYKVDSSGQNLTLLAAEKITSITMSSPILTYKNVSGKEEKIYLNERDQAVTNVINLITAIDETNPTVIEVIKARIAYNALSSSHKGEVNNLDSTLLPKLEAAEVKIKSTEQAEVLEVIEMIAKLNSDNESFETDVTAARSKYNFLHATVNSKVLNYEDLTLKEREVTQGKSKATEWGLSVFNNSTSYKALIEARQTYELMSLWEKSLISSIVLSDLVHQEGLTLKEKNEAGLVEYKINALNSNLVSYIEDVENVRTAYDALADRAKSLVSLPKLTAAETNVNNYNKSAEAFISKIKAWDTDPPTLTYIAPSYSEILEARDLYNSFNNATRELVTNKISSIEFILSQGIEEIAGMNEKVLEASLLIEALDEKAVSTLMEKFRVAKTAYENVTETLGHTFPTKIKDKYEKIEDLVANADKKARFVIDLINDLENAASGDLENKVDEARLAYGALRPFEQYKISKETLDKLESFTSVIDAAKFDVELKGLDGKDLTDPTLPGLIKGLREEYEALSPAVKLLVKELNILEKKEAEQVDVLIGDLNGTPTPLQLREARAAYIALIGKAKDEVTKLNDLEILEAAYVDSLIDGLGDDSIAAEVIEVRKEYDLLSETANKKVTKFATLEGYEARLVDPDEKNDAKSVNEAIVAAYANIATITSEEYEALLAKYNALNTKAKTYVTTENEAKLDELKTAVKAKEIDLEKAKKEADPVIKQINALTSRSSAEDLKKARDAYTALSLAAQKVVQDGDVLKKLEDFEKALTEKEKEAADKAAEEKARAEAREVEIKINAISETSTLEEVQAVYKAYEALSDAKEFVSASAKTKLERLLEAKEKEYKETHGKAQTEAKDVSDRIDKITTATTVKELQSIRRAYDALSDLAKTYVKNLAKLTSSEVYQEQQAKIVAAAKNEAAAFDTYMADLTRNSTTAEIAKARAFYNNLSAEAKKHSKTLEKLIKLETMWSDPDYIDLYLNYYPHYTDQQPTGGIEITAPKPDPLFIPDTVATTNAGPGEIAMDYRDGNYTATVFATDAPGSTKSKLTLTSSNNVKVSLPKKDILALKKLPVTVSTAVGFKSVTISFTEGYTAKTFSDFVEIKVPISELGANSKSVILCKLPNGQYEKASYQVLDGAFVIKTKVGATFVVEDKSTTAPTATASTGYKDINSSANSTYINELAKLGIVSGGTASNYYPSQNITRGDFAIMIARAANLTTSTTTSLTDVRNTANASLIEALNESGIMRGTTSTRFSMSGTVTREEASVILARLFRHLKMDVATMQNEQQTNYRDIANLSYESRRSIALMDLLEIFDSSATAFKPSAKLTRGEFAKVLSKAMEAAELK